MLVSQLIGAAVSSLLGEVDLILDALQEVLRVLFI
jgi:hypothetical protein